jgi:hypothetical protein
VKHDDPADGVTERLPGPEVNSRLEHQLRAGFRARASEISGPPTPLDLPARRAPNPRLGLHYGGAGSLARTRWLVAVGAAVAVLAIIGAALAVADTLPGRQTSSARPIQAVVPPYYVALMAGQPTPNYPADAFVATVRATATGSVVARVRAPRPYAFASVTAAADDRTFVLFAVGPYDRATFEVNPTTGKLQQVSVSTTYAEQFFILRIRPHASTPAARAQLTALPRALIPSGLQVEAMALSPDGESLAAIIQNPGRAIGGIVPGRLTIFNLADGAQRTWTRDACAASGRCSTTSVGSGSIIFDAFGTQLSWTSDGQSVLFIPGPGSPPGSPQARLLDVDAPGSHLIADSLALPITTAGEAWNDAVITPDGKSVFIQYNSRTGSTGQGNLLRFSATTGRAAVVDQVLTHLDGAAPGYIRPDYLLWTNNDGSKFIALVLGGITRAPGETPVPSGETAGIYSGRRYTPLPWPAGVLDAAW